jgi:hypothetical protein
MENFVHKQNIEHFQRLLARVTDDVERRRIEKLLTEELNKDSASKPAAD